MHKLFPAENTRLRNIGLSWHMKNSREIALTANNRGFSCDVKSSQFCKSSYSNRQVVFHFAQPGIGKHNKISRNFLFSPHHNAELQLNYKNISTHTRLKFYIQLWTKSKVTVCLVVFLYATPGQKCVRQHTALCKPSIEHRLALFALNYIIN